MLRPRLQTFDSGKLAERVGYVVLDDAKTVDVDELIDDSFDFIWIETPQKLHTTRFDYRGTVIELEGDRAEALSQTRLAGVRYDVSALKSDSEWQQVEELMAHAAPSRFSNDPHISEAAFRRHKMSLLRSHVENKNGAIALARSAGDPVGYQCSSLNERAVQLYDIAIARQFRQGFAALNLIGWMLERFDIDRVSTRIYDDNAASLRLFQHLGLRPTGRQSHYYHYWPEESR